MKVLTNKALLLVAALLLTGCKVEKKVNSTEVVNDEAVSVASSISYIHDERTGLCFALTSSHSYAGNNIATIATVPCTEKVLALIEK